MLRLVTSRPDLSMVDALYALTEQAERILGESEQPFGPGAEGVGHEVSVVGTQQENLCHLGVRQMQSAKHGHIGPPVFGMIGIQDCDLHTRGGDGVERLMHVCAAESHSVCLAAAKGTDQKRHSR